MQSLLYTPGGIGLGCPKPGGRGIPGGKFPYICGGYCWGGYCAPCCGAWLKWGGIGGLLVEGYCCEEGG